MAKQSICLCMIVKNEAPVIAACLASVLPIIDYWIICDTGSSDGTQQIITDFFAEHDKPGELHERPWQDFAHNRTEALALARPHSDYTLIIDADDLLVLPLRFRPPHLTADAYTIEIRQLERMYPRTQLVRSVLPWRYEGVLHEFLSYADPSDGCRVFPETRNQQSLRGVQIHMGQGGARRRTDTAVRFAHDAAILKQALATETDSFLVARYTFYLAQSLRDSGDAKAALQVYLKRAELGFWQQEVYFSLYEAARVMATLGHQPTDVVAAFWRATAADPRRAEAFHGGARYCREQNRFKEGYKFAKAALGLTLPSGALFAEPWIYEYGLLDEFAVNAFWVGDYKGCLTTCRRLLAPGARLPQEYRPRLEANARLAKEKLHQPKDVSAPVHVEVVNEQPDVDAETIERTASVAPQLAQSLPNLPDPDETQRDRPKQAKAGVRTLTTTRTTNTLHVLGIAHTIPHEDYVVCAFTGKVLAFPDIIQPFGWNVVEYSNEGSASRAREHIPILSRDRLRALSLRRSREEPMDADVNNKPLQEEYQRVLVEKISARAQPGDIVCHVFGPNMPVYDALPKCHHVEMSVGYTASPGLPFRIYESSAWMHWHHGKAGREDGQNYHWVIPSGFDVQAWPYCAEPGDYAIFLGRVTPRKGVTTLIEIARRMPDLPILVYGPGDTAQWEADRPPNLHFKGPVFGAERVEAVRRARCMLMPTSYIEPFGFSGVEAQLCGVPLLGTSFGAFQETIIDGVTGFRCHTLADWIAAIRRSPTLDRKQISDIARRRYSSEAVGQQYNWALEQLADLSGPGWYGEVSRKFPDSLAAKTPRSPRIWLYMPHFGTVPNYFQLYLDSLARNADLLSVIFITDVDLSSFTLPDNLIVVPSTLDAERERAATFLRQALGMDVDVASLLTTPYKFVDLKITYLDLFRDIGADLGVTENDYVGWGDCDLIYGRLADFISMETEYAVIGGFHGHFTAFKNIAPLRTLYRQVEQLPSILLDHNIHGADEIAFRSYLLKYLEETNGKMFYINRYFCDIVPEQFFGLFRTDHASRPKNFFDAYNSDKDIDHVQCDQDGKLIVHYDDGTTREAIYCHLQKRKMALSSPRQAAPFMIREDAFAPQLPPPPVAPAVDNQDDPVAESGPAAATTSPSPPAVKGPNLGTFGEESLIALQKVRGEHVNYILLSHHGHLVAEEHGRLIQIGITAEAEEANLVEIDLAAELTAAAKFNSFISGSDHFEVSLTLPVFGAVIAHVNLVKSEIAFVKDNLYLTAEPSGEVVCNRNQRLAWESFLLMSREGVEQLREILTSSWVIASRRQLVHPIELSLVGGPALVCSDLRIPLCHNFPLDPRHFPFRFPIFVDGWRVEQLIKFQPMIYYVACGRNAVEELALSLESLVDIGGYRGRVSIYTDTMLEEIEDLFADIKTLHVTLLSLPAKDWVGFVSGRLKFIDEPQAAQSAPVAYFDTDIIFNRAVEPLLVDMVCANAPAAALEHFSKMATSPSVGAELLREDNFRLEGVSGFNAGAFSIPNVRDFGHVVEAIRNVLMNYLLIHGRDSLNWLDQAAANYISYRYVPFDTSDVTKYVRYGWSQDAYRLGPLTGLVHFCGIFRSHRLEPMRHYLSLLKSDRCRDHARIDA